MKVKTQDWVRYKTQTDTRLGKNTNTEHKQRYTLDTSYHNDDDYNDAVKLQRDSTARRITKEQCRRRD